MPIEKDRQDEELDNDMGTGMLGGRPRVESDNGLSQLRKDAVVDDEPQDEELKESEAREK